MVQSDATDYDDVQEEPDNNRRTSRAVIGKIQRTKGYGGSVPSQTNSSQFAET